MDPPSFLGQYGLNPYTLPNQPTSAFGHGSSALQTPASSGPWLGPMSYNTPHQMFAETGQSQPPTDIGQAKRTLDSDIANPLLTYSNAGVSGIPNALADVTQQINQTKLPYNGRVNPLAMLRASDIVRGTRSTPTVEPTAAVPLGETFDTRSETYPIAMLPMYTYVKGHNYNRQTHVFSLPALNLFMRDEYLDRCKYHELMKPGQATSGPLTEDSDWRRPMHPSMPSESYAVRIGCGFYGLRRVNALETKLAQLHQLVRDFNVDKAIISKDIDRYQAKLEKAKLGNRLATNSGDRIFYPSLLDQDFLLNGIVNSYTKTNRYVAGVFIGDTGVSQFKTTAAYVHARGPVLMKNLWGSGLETNSRLFLIMTRDALLGYPVIVPWSSPMADVKIPKNMTHYVDVSGRLRRSIVHEVGYVVEVPDRAPTLFTPTQSETELGMQACCVPAKSTLVDSELAYRQLQDIKVYLI